MIGAALKPRRALIVWLIACGETMASSAPPARYQAMAVETLRELVSIDTAEPSGSSAAVGAIATRLKAAGFAEPDVRVLAPPGHPEKSNLVVRLAGRGRGKPVLWTSHLDVVAADPNEWTVPPFALTESDGWYYGRGTSDMKGEIAAVVVALVRLRDEGFVPDRDIVAAFTTDEEAAGHVNGIKWLLSEHRPLIDADIVFNPDAGGGTVRGGKRLYYGIQLAEKTYATYTLTASGKGGHSSRPDDDNAIYRLSAALLRLSTYRFTPRTSTQAVVNELPYTTCVATLLQAGEAENALAQRAQAHFQCRLLPGDSADGVKKTIEEVIADPAVRVELARPVIVSPETVADPHVFAAIQQTVVSTWPGIPVLSKLDAGGSDAIFTRSAGMPTYGVSAIFTDLDDNRRHGRDERISTTAFREGVEFTYRLMKRFGRRH